MVGKRYSRILLLIMCIGSVSIGAQGLPGQSVDASDVHVEATKYEQFYELILNHALSDYYMRGTFIVDATASLERRQVPNSDEVVAGEEAVRAEKLGLPFVPPNLLARTAIKVDSSTTSGFDVQFRLTRITITIQVDSSYSDQDVEFVEAVAKLIAHADATKGDIVTVEKDLFSKSVRAIGQKAPKVDQVEDASQKELMATVEVREPITKMNTFLGFDWNNPKHVWYVVALQGVLMLSLVVFVLLRKSLGTKDGRRVPYSAYDRVAPIPKQSTSEKETKAHDPKTVSKFEADKTYITNYCISHPEIIAGLIGQWVASDDELGVLRASQRLSSVDEKLMNVLEPHLKVETYEIIKYTMHNSKAMPLSEKMEEVEAFRRSIQQENGTNGSADSGSNLFGFIKQLTDIQILHLMKEESDELVAILLAQITGERAGGILQKINDEKRVSILLKMGRINHIPISVYKKVAAHFSNKALSVSDMKYVAADGVDSILTTIETLPLAEQDEYVRSIAEQDDALAKRIRKFFIGFNDLPKVKDDILQSAIEDVKTDVLVLALKTASGAVREKVLKVRPKREQQLILSEIDSPTEVQKSAVEDAQRALLYAVRQKIKAEG